MTHDQDNLYLMYRFADDRLARELLARGVILWVNSEGKTKNKDEAYGLRYGGSSQIERSFEEAPGPSQGSPPDHSQEDRRRPPRPPGPVQGRAHPDELTRIRFGVKEPISRTSDAEPAAASAATENGFCYELRIPIADVGGKVASQPRLQSGGSRSASRSAALPRPRPKRRRVSRRRCLAAAELLQGAVAAPGAAWVEWEDRVEGVHPWAARPAADHAGMKKRAGAEIVWLTVVLETTPDAESPS